MGGVKQDSTSPLTMSTSTTAHGCVAYMCVASMYRLPDGPVDMPVPHATWLWLSFGVAVVVVVLPVNVAELSGKISHVVTTFMYDEPGVSDMTWMWGWRFDIAYKRVASATDDAG